MPPAPQEEASPQVTAHTDLDTAPVPAATPVRSWPVVLLALPAFVAVWSGWVGLGELTGFGVVHPLPGIADGFTINSAITLPIGVETYAAFALQVWLSGQVPASARRFAKWSALSALVLGALGQVAYHLLEAAGVTQAPWQITTVVACLPVAVLGMGAALAHLIHARPTENGEN
jgi:cytochrome bd-type quinol oxidase subunit 2